jgi:sugar/nucleoside kinase (ribokinase family)
LPKTKIAWNPGNEQIKLGLDYLKTYLKNTDIFIVNKDEAIEICLSKNSVVETKHASSLQDTKIANPRYLLKTLSSYCPNTVVITDGHNGAYCFYDKKIYYEPSCHIKVKDTTGVGDAFGATFVWALYETNYNIQKSLNLAIKNACSVLQEVGAQNGLLSLARLRLY